MRCSRIAAWLVAATGMLVLLGWMFDVQVLKGVLPGFVTMKTNTALAFLLLGTAAVQLHRSGSATSRRIIQLIALAVSLLGALTLAEYVLGWNLSIDQLLFSEASGVAGSQFHGRMSSVAALNFIFLGSGLLILASQRRALQRVGDAVTYVVALIGFVALAGYLYGVPSLYRVSTFNALAVHTAALFIVLAIALLAAPPIRGVAAILVGDDVGATLARRLLPVAAFAPPLVGYLWLVGQQWGLYGTEFGLALFATSNVIIFAVVIYSAAASLRNADLERRDSERALRISEHKFQLLINNAQDYATLMLDLDGRIVSWNEGAQRLKGYTAEEILGQHFSRFYTPEDLATHKPADELVRAAANGTCEDEGWRVRKDGSRFWASVVIVALKDGQGRLQGFGKITHDRTERKRIEDARRESEQRLCNITDSLTSGLVVSTLEGQIFHWNKTAVALFGFDDSEAWLRKLPEFVNTFELATLDGRVLELEEWPLARVIAGEKLRDCEVLVRRVDIDWQGILSFSGDIVVEDSGRSVAFLSFADVTEPKRHETELKQTNERFAMASEAAGLGFWDFDIRSNTLLWDEQMFAFYGRSRSTGEQPYSLWSDSLHPDDRQRSEQEVLNAINGTRDFHTEFRVVHPNGDIRHLKASAHVVRDSEGHAVQMIGVNVDITERKQAEDALRESEQRYRFLAEAMPQIIWTAKTDGNPDYYNQRAYDYTGMTFEQARDWGWTTVAHPDDLQNARDQWARSITTGCNYEVEYRLKRAADGVFRWHLGRAFPLRDRHGAIIQWVGTYTDIDDQKLAEEGLREAYVNLEQRVSERTAELSAAKSEADRANAAKSEFLANMSHEIRTPMNGVIGMTHLLLDTELSAQQGRFAQAIRDSADALLTIINDILDFSKIESGKLAFEVLDFDLREAVENTLELLSERAHAKRLELASLIGPEVPIHLRGDPGRLRQVLNNLIGNAIKFTERGEVALHVDREAETETEVTLRFDITDSGIGISPEAQKRLFQAFTQADSTTTRRYGGTGLGLAICKQLIELMHGQIGVRSDLGKGSTFYFTVTLGKQPHPAAARPDTALDLSSMHVLVVNDNATNREDLQHHFEAWRMRASCVADGQAALRALREASASGDHFDLAILDLSMPDMDGLTLSCAIGCDPAIRNTKIIMLTSLGEQPDPEALRAGSISAYLVKPVKQSRLFDCIGAAMASDSRVNFRPAKVAIAASPDLQPTRKLRILLAEDNVINQQVAIEQLQKLGYAADTAVNGLEVLAAVEHIPYDVILMDCMMPEMDGYEATARIRNLEREHSREFASNKRLYVIAMTANAMQGDREKCLAAGMDDYVSKPVQLAALQRALANYTPQKGSSSESALDSDAERSADPPVDIGRLTEVTSGNPEKLRRLVSAYLKQAEETIAGLHQAIAAEAAKDVRHLAHKLRGSSAACGMGAMEPALYRLERIGESGDLRSAEDANTETTRQLARVRQFLDDHLGALSQVP